MHDRNAAPGATQLLALPSALSGTSQPSGSDSALSSGSLYLVSAPGGVSWQQVRMLNTHGYEVFSRQVVAHPPPKAQVPYSCRQASPVAAR